MPVVTYDGVPLLGADTIVWGLTSGTDPFTTSVEVEAGIAQALAQKMVRPLDLVIEGATFRKVYLMEVHAGATPFTRRLILADRRWRWARTWIRKKFNWRRRTGNTRIAYGTGSSQLEALQEADIIDYAPWSLNSGTRFTAIEALDDVLSELGESQYTLPVGANVNQMRIEHLTVDSAGDAALDRMLHFLPGSDVTVDRNGLTRIFTKLDSIAATVDNVGNAGAPVVGSGTLTQVDRSRLRPTKVRVYFTPEVEVRFDYTTASATAAQEKTDAESGDVSIGDLVNVGPSPDPKVGEVVRGTWTTFQDFYDLWAGSEIGQAKAGLGPINDEIVRRHAKRAHVSLEFLYAMDSGNQPDLTWQSRIKVIRLHWRKTFRLHRTWIDRILTLKAERLAIIDQVTGLRPPAEAYADYIVKPSMRSLAKQKTGLQGTGWTVEGYAENLADARPVPAELRVLDAQAGVFTVQPQIDPWGEGAGIMFGALEGQAPAEAVGGVVGKIALWESEEVRLKKDWQLATVMTVTPAAPNSTGALFAVDVSPGDVEEFVGPVGSCRGELYEVRIPAGLTTAWFGWRDEDATQTRDYLLRGGKPPTSLLLNKTIVRAVARAAAARVYERMLDRIEGRAAVPFNPRVVVDGSVESVMHAVSTSGAVLTGINCPPVSSAQDLDQYLPDSVRAVLERMATT